MIIIVEYTHRVLRTPFLRVHNSQLTRNLPINWVLCIRCAKTDEIPPPLLHLLYIINQSVCLPPSAMATYNFITINKN